MTICRLRLNGEPLTQYFTSTSSSSHLKEGDGVHHPHTLMKLDHATDFQSTSVVRKWKSLHLNTTPPHPWCGSVGEVPFNASLSEAGIQEQGSMS
ncbi:hypothetical protein L1887_39100 [Cichorium endivia]|nr:hypothetical protein L1887_39100 [Cichorium endivia]